MSDRGTGGAAPRAPADVVFLLAPAAKILLFARMLFSRRTAVLVVLAALAPCATFGASTKRAAPTRPAAKVDNTAAYRGAIVIDAANGQVLFEDRADYSGPPASMTKLMTFAVLHDKLASGALALDTPVRIMNEDNIGGTQVFLDPRETFPVEELIYAMMIQSANDAARALARASAGSVETFVAQMNQKARELGMTHTTFRSPHGLPPTGRRLADSDITTPRDYALLSRHLLLHTDVLKYTSVRNRDFAPDRAKGAFKMENHNKLLGKVAGVDGLKTGFTDAAGYCTTITAERKEHRIVVVIMGSFGPNGQHDLGKVRDMKAIELLEQGFAALTPDSPVFVPPRPVTPVSATAPVTRSSTAPAASGSPMSAAPKTDATAKPAASGSDSMIRFTVPTAPKKK
jgi:D-alanyl-D-alanine carboxypeptidase